jgi:selenocysteine-specific elongation factor
LSVIERRRDVRRAGSRSRHQAGKAGAFDGRAAIKLKRAMKHVVVGTAGHIDHGKSSLVLALTGTDPDRLQEEKARGITIDLGFAHTVEGDVVLSFVDVPGHERFVRNMLAGVGGMDLVMLHVAADESVMPQTREHFEICRLLHVPAGLVVVTKADLVDAETIDVVRLEVQDLVAGSFLDGAPVVAVSARDGTGLDELRQTLARLASTSGGRPASGPPRLPIDRVFSMRGFGTVITGTLVSGRLGVDDELVLSPTGRRVKVRGIQVHGHSHHEAVAGQRVAANVAGAEVSDVARGETLTTADAVTVTRRVDVAIELLASARPLRHGARVRFHQGTRELAARVALPAAQLEPGSQGFGRVHLEQPASLVRGDRFILRASSPLETIGGGTVLDPLPARRGVRTAAAAARFDRLSGSAAGSAAAMIEEGGLQGLPVAQLGGRVGLSGGDRDALIEEWKRAGVAVRIGDALLAAPRLASVQQQVLDAVRRHHGVHPLEEGIPREEVRERLFSTAAPGVFEHVLAVLSNENQIVARDRVALRGHTLALTDEEAAARDAMVRVLTEGGLAPPDGSELTTRVGARKEVIDRVANLLVRQKVLVRLGDMLFHASALQRLKDEVVSLKREHATDRIDVATFKDRYHITRKYAIPLLEFLDRERITRRVGDARQIL